MSFLASVLLVAFGTAGVAAVRRGISDEVSSTTRKHCDMWDVSQAMDTMYDAETSKEEICHKLFKKGDFMDQAWTQAWAREYVRKSLEEKKIKCKDEEMDKGVEFHCKHEASDGSCNVWAVSREMDTRDAETSKEEICQKMFKKGDFMDQAWTQAWGREYARKGLDEKGVECTDDVLDEGMKVHCGV
ncbi:unnamed protein product [Symbiodinium pilosum]|uniref:Uncharacterized protein n=1 Tax=Symbiodinium pilosum TaxID=2952 RepID=A0A812VVB1_SYMPI|nr:unnamed protein product [Symbiodinium pilosum]